LNLKLRGETTRFVISPHHDSLVYGFCPMDRPDACTEIWQMIAEQTGLKLEETAQPRGVVHESESHLDYDPQGPFYKTRVGDVTVTAGVRDWKGHHGNKYYIQLEFDQNKQTRPVDAIAKDLGGSWLESDHRPYGYTCASNECFRQCSIELMKAEDVITFFNWLQENPLEAVPEKDVPYAYA
ncbi:hypothetical protein KY362_02265, partial [Candidatus Woesearchaeota archaeon]|nr:hypothetical protein [Candidatus Woesearchaeota archaeon]